MAELTESKKAKSARAAQDFLTLDTIRDGVVLMKDGSLRIVLMASAFNFALKAPEEQDAIISQYQNFLNSVDFPLQFMIQSRRLNIEPYVAMMREFEKAQENELLKIQTAEYIDFVKEFVELSNIMAKNFYVVVPFSPSIAEKSGLGGIFSQLFGKRTTTQTDSGADSFNEHRIQLLQRVDAVQLGLQRFGVRSVALKTDELIELFSGIFNLKELEKEKQSSASENNR